MVEETFVGKRIGESRSPILQSYCDSERKVLSRALSSGKINKQSYFAGDYLMRPPMSIITLLVLVLA